MNRPDRPFRAPVRVSVSGFLLIASTLLFGFAACGRSAEEAYKKGEQLWEAGRYVEAVDAYTKAVEIDSNRHIEAEALYQIGNIYYLNIKDYRKAVDAYRKLVDKSPKSHFAADAQRNIAEIYKEKFDDVHGAIAEYQKLKRLFPDEADKAVFQIAKCYFSLKDFPLARAHYDAIIQQFPEVEYMDQVYYERANTYYLEGMVSESITGFKTFIDKFPDSKLASEAKFHIALLYEEDGNLEEALKRLHSLSGIYYNERILNLRIKGIEERIAAKNRPAPPKKKSSN